jgi:hypothetical protein
MLAHGPDAVLYAHPDQWGKLRSYTKGTSCPAKLWAAIQAGNMFDKMRAARLEVVQGYPTGQRRFGTPWSDERREICNDLATYMNREHKRWIMELAALVSA